MLDCPQSVPPSISSREPLSGGEGGVAHCSPSTEFIHYKKLHRIQNTRRIRLRLQACREAVTRILRGGVGRILRIAARRHHSHSRGQTNKTLTHFDLSSGNSNGLTRQNCRVTISLLGPELDLGQYGSKHGPNTRFSRVSSRVQHMVGNQNSRNCRIRSGTLRSVYSVPQRVPCLYIEHCGRVYPHRDMKEKGSTGADAEPQFQRSVEY